MPRLGGGASLSLGDGAQGGGRALRAGCGAVPCSGGESTLRRLCEILCRTPQPGRGHVANTTCVLTRFTVRCVIIETKVLTIIDNNYRTAPPVHTGHPTDHTRDSTRGVVARVGPSVGVSRKAVCVHADARVRRVRAPTRDTRIVLCGYACASI